MSLRDFVERVTTALDSAGVPYMVCGSVASTFHSRPRTTQDVDIVVEVDDDRLRTLLARFPEDAYYVSEDAAREALRRRSMFNIIDLATGWKADVRWLVESCRSNLDVDYIETWATRLGLNDAWKKATTPGEQ